MKDREENTLQEYLTHLPHCNIMQDWTEAEQAMADTPEEFRDEGYNVAYDEMGVKKKTCTCGLKEVWDKVFLPSLPSQERRAIAEKILYEILIGVNKEAVEKHHDFKKSILKAMEEFARVSPSPPQQPYCRCNKPWGVSGVCVACENPIAPALPPQEEDKDYSNALHEIHKEESPATMKQIKPEPFGEGLIKQMNIDFVKGRISFGKFVELLNEKAQQYAKQLSAPPPQQSQISAKEFLQMKFPMWNIQDRGPFNTVSLREENLIEAMEEFASLKTENL